MSGKKLLIIAFAMAVVSFGGTFFLTQMFSEPALPKETDEAANAEIRAEALAKVKLTPKSDQLQALILIVTEKNVALDLRDRMLNKREKRIEETIKQLKRDAQTLDDLRTALTAPVLSLEKAILDLEESRVLIQKTEIENIQRTAKICEKLEAEKGSKILEGMCTNNQTNHAAKILSFMSDKGAAKILGEFTDTKLVAELLERMKRIKQEGQG